MFGIELVNYVMKGNECMKAGVVFANEDIRYTDFEEPSVSAKTVKIRVKATGICGSDVPRVLHNGAHFYPVVLGHEFAGDVAEIGSDVTSVKVGDTVTAAPLVPCMSCAECLTGDYALCKKYSFIGSREQGSFADYVVVPEQNVVKYDKSIPYEQAAMFEPSTVALHGIYCNDYKGGEDVAIIGCGTIGIFVLQWAKILGAKRIVAFDTQDERLELAKEMGATHVINSSKPDYMDEVNELTNGKGFKYVFEMVGHPVTILMSFVLASAKANICLVGTPHIDVKFTPKEWELMNRKEFKLTGSWMSYSAPFPGKEWDMTAHYFKTGELKFHPDFIYKKMPMSDIDKAFELYKNPKDVKGKIMLINE